jgi:hypothetical protein
MSNLLEHAKSELCIAGYYSGDPIDAYMADCVMRLMEVFVDEGHSGGSASSAIYLFKKLSQFEPISPLTGEDCEWVEVADGMFQNNRCSHVFKENGVAYDIDAIIFTDEYGCSFTNSESKQNIEFPYMPVKTYVNVVADDQQ